MLNNTFLFAQGVATPNPDFKPNDPHSESLIIIKPDRIASFDETHTEVPLLPFKCMLDDDAFPLELFIEIGDSNMFCLM